jgi:hypothetical protein
MLICAPEMSGFTGPRTPAVDEEYHMSDTKDLEGIVAEISKALCGAKVRNSSIVVSTPVAYPNGVGAAVRIDRGRNGYVVSDDGYASVIAETMQASSALNRIATGVATRSGISFERGTFLASGIERADLPVAVSLIANSSCRAIERVVASLEQPRIRRARDVFDRRLREAFGDRVRFNLDYRGATGRTWQFDAGLERDGAIVRLFELVSPTTQAVAIANMKIADTVVLPEAPKVTAALADYDGTEPALRSILSNAGGTVIAAKDDISRYRLVA